MAGGLGGDGVGVRSVLVGFWFRLGALPSLCLAPLVPVLSSSSP